MGGVGLAPNQAQDLRAVQAQVRDMKQENDLLKALVNMLRVRM
jgi:hypothetical protein